MIQLARKQKSTKAGLKTSVRIVQSKKGEGTLSLRVLVILGENEKALGFAPRAFVKCCCGGVLLSHILSNAVPSPCQVLASGFGMMPGVSPGP